MDQERLLEALRRFDMDPDQARLYLALLRQGPRKASDLAESTGFHRTKVYRLLDDLVARDAVRASVGRPTVFAPRSPEAVLGEVVEARSSDLRELAHLRDELDEPLREIQQAEPRQEAGQDWRVLQGREAILRRLESMIRRAEDRFRVLSTDPATTRFTPEVEEAWRLLVERAETGLDVSVLLEAGDRTAERLRELGPPRRLDVRRVDLRQRVHVDIADDREVLAWLVFDPSSRFREAEDVAVWSDAPGLVATHDLLFRALHGDAQPLKLR